MEVALFFHLGGDVDILSPFLRPERYPDIRFRILVSSRQQENPRLKILLDTLDLAADFVIDTEAADTTLSKCLFGSDALLTSSESTLRPHLLAHRLTITANEMGVSTYTMQHGIENIGLSYFDEYQGTEVVFASSTVFTWQSADRLPYIVDTGTRQKAVATGYSAPERDYFAPMLSSLSIPGKSAECPNKKLIGVFENMHWTRFSDEYRRQFISDLEYVCQQRPDINFLIKPHPEGRWLTERYGGTKPEQTNLLIADPKDSAWGLFTAPSLMPFFDAVITTPSKVALDGALDGIPIAIPSYDGSYDYYSPLNALDDAKDWLEFVDQAISENAALKELNKQFVDNILLNQNGSDNVVKYLMADHAQRNAQLLAAMEV